MKTYQPKAKEVKRAVHNIDAKDQILGRLATQIAGFLMGKNKPTYSAHIDSGDNVVVVNAEKVVLTGKKTLQKVYRRHSGFPGGFHERNFREQMEVDPRKILESAVSGMLPDNKLKKERLKRLKLIVGEK